MVFIKNVLNENSMWSEEGQIMIESIFEKPGFSKSHEVHHYFLKWNFMIFFLHNMISLVIVHINILKLSKIICIYIEFTRYFIFYSSNIFSSNFLT